MELGSVRQTLLWFLEEVLQVPSRAVDSANHRRRFVGAATIDYYGTLPLIGTDLTYMGHGGLKSESQLPSPDVLQLLHR